MAISNEEDIHVNVHPHSNDDQMMTSSLHQCDEVWQTSTVTASSSEDDEYVDMCSQVPVRIVTTGSMTQSRSRKHGSIDEQEELKPHSLLQLPQKASYTTYTTYTIYYSITYCLLESGSITPLTNNRRYM